MDERFAKYYQSGDVREWAWYSAVMAKGLLHQISAHKNQKNFELFHFLEKEVDLSTVLRSKNASEEIIEAWHNVSFENVYIRKIDEVLLIGAFENCAKAALLRRNIVVHQFNDKQLEKHFGYNQKQKPLKCTSLKRKLDSGEIRKIPQNTIPTSYLFLPAYRRLIMAEKIMKHLEQVNRARNMIHFTPPGIARSVYQPDWIETLKALEKRINNLIKSRTVTRKPRP